MLFCLPTTHVDAHLGNYGLRVLYFDAIDSRKVHPRDASSMTDFSGKCVSRPELSRGPCLRVRQRKRPMWVSGLELEHFSIAGLYDA
jgi:hypothetical protein